MTPDPDRLHGDGRDEQLQDEIGQVGRTVESLYLVNDPVLTGLRIANAIWQAVHGGNGPLGPKPVEER